MATNTMQVRNAFDLVESFGKRKIGMLGLSFKAKTDDLRESPLVELAEMLIGKGYELSIFDKNVEYARVHGDNRDYINSKLPQLSSLLNSDLPAVNNDSELLVPGLGDCHYYMYVKNIVRPYGRE